MMPRKLMERGQALVVIALSAVVLFGFAALAIDGSAKFSDRRHAQNAADTAALAASLAKVNALLVPTNSNTPAICPPTSGSPSDVCAALQLDGLNRAISNGYGDDIAKSTVKIYSPPISGYYKDNDNYVQVIITSKVKTTFARILGVDETVNIVEAVSLARPGGKWSKGASISAYNPDTSSGCSGTFTVGGGSTITLNGGGVFVNSNAPDCAFEQTGGCPNNGDPLLVINGGGINSAGNGNVDFDGCFTNPPSVTYNQKQIKIPDDVTLPDKPAQCGQAPVGNYSSNGQNGTTFLHEGYYTSFPPMGSKNTVQLSPGIYCVDDNTGIHWTGTNFKITGDNITIFITNGANHDLEITGGLVNLKATNSGYYKGYLFIVETDFTGSPATCKINGSTDITLSGTVFAPYCNFTINGNNNSSTPVDFGTQIVAWNVTLSGSSKINFTYDPAKNAVENRTVGLMK